ncbi:MAG: hypothetical protein AAF871_03480 [Pseudomonadota bacterium]
MIQRMFMALLCVALAGCGGNTGASSGQTVSGRLFGPYESTALVIEFGSRSGDPFNFAPGNGAASIITAIAFDGRQAANGPVIISGPISVTELGATFLINTSPVSSSPEGLELGGAMTPLSYGRIELAAAFADGRAQPVTVADLEGTIMRWTFEAQTAALDKPRLMKTGRLRSTGKSKTGLILYEDP